MTPRRLLAGRDGDPEGSAGSQDICRRVQAILLDLADRRSPSADAHVAIDHLETCDDCQADLASTALVLTALRRLADEVDDAVPDEGSWRQVAARLAAAPPPRRLRVGNVAGALAGLALVVALALPPMLSRSYSGSVGGSDAATNNDTDVRTTVELPRNPSPGRGLLLAPADAAPVDQSVPVRYPDNIRPAPGGGSGAQD